MADSTDLSRGWVKAIRSEDALELLRANPLALALAYVIAMRAKWREGFNRHGLGQGEAMLGDFESYGMTEQQYRTAKSQLQKWNFATFRATNKGTAGKLIDSRLFEVFSQTPNDQDRTQPTTEQRAANGQPTTNEDRKKGKKVKDESLKGHAIRNQAFLELIRQAREVLGETEWNQHHNRWFNRAKTDPDKLRRVLADTRNKASEDGLDNPAAWAEAQWKRFK